MNYILRGTVLVLLTLLSTQAEARRYHRVHHRHHAERSIGVLRRADIPRIVNHISSGSPNRDQNREVPYVKDQSRIVPDWGETSPVRFVQETVFVPATNVIQSRYQPVETEVDKIIREANKRMLLLITPQGEDHTWAYGYLCMVLGGLSILSGLTFAPTHNLLIGFDRASRRYHMVLLETRSFIGYLREGGRSLHSIITGARLRIIRKWRKWKRRYL